MAKKKIKLVLKWLVHVFCSVPPWFWKQYDYNYS